VRGAKIIREADYSRILCTRRSSQSRRRFI